MDAILAQAPDASTMVANFIRVVAPQRPAVRPAGDHLRVPGAGRQGARRNRRRRHLGLAAEPATRSPISPTRSSSKIGKTVTLDQHVDPSLIGGLIVKVGSQMIDSSLKTKLTAMKIAMKEVG